MIEIYVYLALSPIPFAFFPLGGDGIGISRITSKFCKSFIGVCLQAVVMIVSPEVYKVITVHTFDSIGEDTDFFIVIGKLLISSIVMIMAVTKSSSWAKNLIDAS